MTESQSQPKPDPQFQPKVATARAWREARALLLEHRRSLALGLFLMLISRLAGLVLPASTQFLIDEGIAMGFTRTYALGLYHQRSGTSNDLPFTRFVHAADHTAPAQIPVQSDPQFAFTWATIACRR